MDAIHRLLAYGSAAAALVGIVWSLILVVSGGRFGGPRFDYAQAAIVAVFVVAAASGGLLLLIGPAPRDGLHILYAGVSLAVIPLARSFLGRAGGRPAAVLMLAAFVVLGAVTWRLFTTG